MIPVPTGSSLALDCLSGWDFVGTVKNLSMFTVNIDISGIVSTKCYMPVAQFFFFFSPPTAYVKAEIIVFPLFYLN